MEFGFLPAPPSLSHIVKAVWFARGSRSEFDHAEPIVPDGCVELIFNLADPFEEVDDRARVTASREICWSVRRFGQRRRFPLALSICWACAYGPGARARSCERRCGASPIG